MPVFTPGFKELRKLAQNVGRFSSEQLLRLQRMANDRDKLAKEIQNLLQEVCVRAQAEDLQSDMWQAIIALMKQDKQLKEVVDQICVRTVGNTVAQKQELVELLQSEAMVRLCSEKLMQYFLANPTQSERMSKAFKNYCGKNAQIAHMVAQNANYGDVSGITCELMRFIFLFTDVVFIKCGLKPPFDSDLGEEPMKPEVEMQRRLGMLD